MFSMKISNYRCLLLLCHCGEERGWDLVNKDHDVCTFVQIGILTRMASELPSAMHKEKRDPTPT